jgi:hypothetical protein
MSKPTNRTAVRGEVNRSAQPSQAHKRQRVEWADAVDVVHQRPRAGHTPGGGKQSAAQPIQVLGVSVHDWPERC